MPVIACRADDVPEIVTLGRTLARWREEILNHHLTGRVERAYRRPELPR